VATLATGCVRLLWRFAPPDEVGADAFDEDVPLQIGFAPGRTRTAVRRNRIRRLLRETFRTQCQPRLLSALRARSDDDDRVLTVMALFRSDPEATPDDAIRRDLERAMQKLTDKL